jgi:tetratricopeptide (TPR) repeat protein
MAFSEHYSRLLNAPTSTGLAVALGLAALLVIAGLVMSFGTHRWLARSVGALGLVLIMLVLFTVRQQTVTYKVSDVVTATRPRYSQRARLYAGAGLLGVPVVAGVLMFSVLLATRSKLRAQVPRHLKAGRKHFVQKEYDAALHEYNQAINFAPYSGEAFCRRGCVYRAMGQAELALADFDRAIGHDPRLASAYLERGKMRTENGDLDGALADFQQLMLMRANDPEFHLNRGICLMKKGLSSDAAADFELVLKLTNHSDFADPAKKHLRQVEGQANPSSSPRTANANAPPVPPYSSKPAAQDYVL